MGLRDFGIEVYDQYIGLGDLDQPIDVSLDSTFFAISPTTTAPLPVT